MLPRSLRGAVQEYHPPSLLSQHRVLAIVFAVLFLALAGYCLLAPHGTRYTPPPKPPIYVEPLAQ
jgi:hypothetical protein